MSKIYDVVNIVGEKQFTYQLYSNIKPEIDGSSNLNVNLHECAKNCPPYPVPAPTEPIFSVQRANIVQTNPPCSAGSNTTFDTVFLVDGVVVNSVSGNEVNTAGIGSTSPCNGTPTRAILNYPGISFSNSGIPKPNAYALYTENPTYEQNGTAPNFFYTLIAWNDSWSTPFDTNISEAQANYASALAQWEADKEQWEIDHKCC